MKGPAVLKTAAPFMFNPKELNQMNTQKIRTTVGSLAVAAIATFGLAACDTGTEPGQINTERSDIKEEGSIVGGQTDDTTRYSDTTNLEKYYEHADHENHDNNAEGTAVHAGDGKSNGIERDEVQ